jgi:hypothetical protein
MSSKSEVLGYFIPATILSELFSELLSLEDVCRFDTAICNKKKRPLFLECVSSESCLFLGDSDQDLSCNAISWLKNRSIGIKHLKCSHITDDVAVKICSIGSCLHWLSIRDGNMTDKNMIKIIGIYVCLCVLERL